MLAVLAVLAPVALGRQYTRCELSRILVNDFGFNRLVLPNWICLIENESRLNATAINGPFRDDTFRFGLFQISDGFWCNNGSTPGKECNITCSSLLDDNLEDDVACANRIFDRYQDFVAWDGWVRYCVSYNVKNIDSSVQLIFSILFLIAQPTFAKHRCLFLNIIKYKINHI